MAALFILIFAFSLRFYNLIPRTIFDVSGDQAGFLLSSLQIFDLFNPLDPYRLNKNRRYH